MALDLPLPKRLLVHSHWTVGKKKMSKSVGNVINPFETMEAYGADAARYFLARVGGRFKYNVGVSRPVTRCDTMLTISLQPILPHYNGRLDKDPVRQTQHRVDVPCWKLLLKNHSQEDGEASSFVTYSDYRRAPGGFQRGKANPRLGSPRTTWWASTESAGSYAKSHCG